MLQDPTGLVKGCQMCSVSHIKSVTVGKNTGQANPKMSNQSKYQQKRIFMLKQESTVGEV